MAWRCWVCFIAIAAGQVQAVDGVEIAQFSEFVASPARQSRMTSLRRCSRSCPASATPPTVVLSRGLSRRHADVGMARGGSPRALDDAKKTADLTMFDAAGEPVARYHLESRVGVEDRDRRPQVRRERSADGDGHDRLREPPTASPCRGHGEGRRPHVDRRRRACRRTMGRGPRRLRRDACRGRLGGGAIRSGDGDVVARREPGKRRAVHGRVLAVPPGRRRRRRGRVRAVAWHHLQGELRQLPRRQRLDRTRRAVARTDRPGPLTPRCGSPGRTGWRISPTPRS